MPAAVVVRLYKFQIEHSDQSLHSSDYLLKILTDFVSEHTDITTETEIQRSWFFTPRNNLPHRAIHGLISYGTYGFESRLVDNKTRIQNYNRLSTDLEEVPLYFQFWFPENKKFGLAAFQSFQGRSCVTLIHAALRNYINTKKDNAYLKFIKIIPGDIQKLLQTDVKSLRLVKKPQSSDSFEGYLKDKIKSETEYEVRITAKRGKILGRLGDFIPRNVQDGKATITHEGAEFEEIKAEILWNGKKRLVTTFGPQENTGSIELSDIIEYGSDGHPIFDSIDSCVNDLLADAIVNVE